MVCSENTALARGSGSLEVYATPELIALVERAAVDAVASHCRPGESTVGTMVEIKHLAATPVGLEVKARVELVEVQGRRLLFRIAVWDEREKVAEGSHERFLINESRFMSRANGKVRE